MLDIAMSVVGTVGMVKSGGIKPARWYFTEEVHGAPQDLPEFGGGVRATREPKGGADDSNGLVLVV